MYVSMHWKTKNKIEIYKMLWNSNKTYCVTADEQSGQTDSPRGEKNIQNVFMKT